MNLLDPLQTTPLVDRLAGRLSDAILSGELPLGSALREQSLALSLGVSRGPLREALRRLEGRKLIERVPNHGPRVISLETSDVLEIFILREALEGIACRTATERMTRAEIDGLAQLVNEQFSNLERQQHTFETDLDFHARIIDSAGNRRLSAILQEELYYLIKIFRRRSESVPGRGRRSIEEHHEIVMAMRERDAALAESLMRRHVRNSRDNLVREGVATTGGGK